MRTYVLHLVVAVAACGGSSGTGSSDASQAESYDAGPDAPPPIPHTLTVTITGSGRVTSAPAGIDCTAICSGQFAEGRDLTLTAVPGAGQAFAGWSGGGCSGTSPCTLSLTADTTVDAVFQPTADAPSCENGGVIFDGAATSGFGRQLVVSADSGFNATDIAFVPGSTSAFVVTLVDGRLRYYDGGCTHVNEIDLAPVLPVVDGDEQGLLNVEFHPDFATNGFVFLYHTSTDGLVNSISRMTASFDAGGALVLSDPVRIIDFRKTGPAGNHNGGGLVFAPDGTLLASVGEGADAPAAQRDDLLVGKVLRVSPSLLAGVGGYTVPPTGNMFPPTNPPCTDVVGSALPCPEIVAVGLRNPFRMSIDGNIVYLGEVGAGYEEVNSFDVTSVSVTSPVNFGWPLCQGPNACDASVQGWRAPVFFVDRDGPTGEALRAEDPEASASGQQAIMIGDVYRGDRYDGALSRSLLFGDFYDGFVRGVGVNDSGAITDTDAAPGLHLFHEYGITSMVEGPDGYLYFTQLYTTSFDSGTVYRLVKQ